MAAVLLFLALVPTACLVAVMVIRLWEPRSSYSPRERGSWSLSPDSPLHKGSRYGDRGR